MIAKIYFYEKQYLIFLWVLTNKKPADAGSINYFRYW